MEILISGTYKPIRVECEEVLLTSTWQAYKLSVSSFPLHGFEKHFLRTLLQNLSITVADNWQLVPEVFLQFNDLHRDNGSEILRLNAQNWMPEVGLGVWLDQELPTLWAVEEFMNVVPGEVVRPLMHPVLRITTSVTSRHEARNLMVGRGTIIQIMSSPNDNIVEQMTTYLSPKMIEPAFQFYPFYLPLFSLQWLQRATEQSLANDLQKTKLYFRESVEDRSILVLSCLPIKALLQSLILKTIFKDNCT
jgi:hypothetical protein